MRQIRAANVPNRKRPANLTRWRGAFVAHPAHNSPIGIPNVTPTGGLHWFERDELPLVKAGPIYSYARSYRDNAVDVQWEDGDAVVHCAWWPTELVSRMDEADWHGKPLMF